LNYDHGALANHDRADPHALALNRRPRVKMHARHLLSTWGREPVSVAHGRRPQIFDFSPPHPARSP
jgi:hypothetical protein